MTPSSCINKVAGMALLTAAGMSFLLEKLFPAPSDLVAGAIHFRKGMEEFQKGLGMVLFGSTGSSADGAKKERESGRIPID